MATSKYESSSPVFTTALKRRILTGAGLGLLIVGFFVITAGRGNPSWGSLWQIKPLLLTPIGGAIVGVCYDLTERLRKMEGWWGKAFLVLSVIGAVIGLWMSVVLGLAGTMWD